LKPTDAIATVIRERRLARKLSQEKLAELSNLDRTFISMLERGVRQPTVATLFAIAKALGIRASDIVRDAEDRSK
jgi:transcriptional regulator with XRE-family HTH domain